MVWKGDILHVKGQRAASSLLRLYHVFSDAPLGDHGENNYSYSEGSGDGPSHRCSVNVKC